MIKVLIKLLPAFFLIMACTSQKKVVFLQTSKMVVDSINFDYDTHIYLKAKIQNRNVNLIFDTGADGLYLDSVFVAKEKIEFGKLGYAKLGGAGVKEKRVNIIRDSLFCNLDNFKLKSVMTPILQLRPIIGRKADGILGNSEFRNKVLFINYTSQKLYVLKHFNEDIAQHFKKIAIHERKNRFYIDASVNVMKDLVIKGEFLIDFGSGGVISFTNNASMQNSMSDKIKNKITSNSIHGGIGGDTSDTFFIANSISVSGFSFQKERLSYSNDKVGALSNRDYLGLIGNGFFQRFNVIIDFKNKCMYLKPNKNFHKKTMNNNLGFSYVDRTDIEKGLVVSLLFNNSDAEKRGLKLGDIITHINDKKVEDINDYSFFEKAKNKVKFKIRFLRNNITQEICITTNNLFNYANNCRKPNRNYKYN